MHEFFANCLFWYFCQSTHQCCLLHCTGGADNSHTTQQNCIHICIHKSILSSLVFLNSPLEKRIFSMACVMLVISSELLLRGCHVHVTIEQLMLLLSFNEIE